MASKPPTTEPHFERPGPAEFKDPLVRREMQKAAVWFGMALAIIGVITLGQPLLLIIGGAIFAVLLDGGIRFLGRYLPIPRGWRMLIVLLLVFGFLGWVFWFAGTTIAAQFEALRTVVSAQFGRLLNFASSMGLMDSEPTNWRNQLLGGAGRLTSAVGTVVGGVASIIAMIVIGIFLASEPKLYDRGIAWMLPLRHRTGFYRIAKHVGFTLRRLLFGRLVGMVFEGVFTWFMLTIGGVPMAGLLGLVTGVLAFIPNIGAIISGILMIAVGFSASPHLGIWCIVIYFLVHNIDAYVVVPFVARRTVDLAPAVLLAMQLLMAALFGVLGVLFADPILATLKVVLIDLSKQHEIEGNEPAEVVSSSSITAASPAAAAAASAVASAAAVGAGQPRPERPSGRAPRN
ncbi:MAG TPA: AI-2E family transporter [Sphingomicrobium sp.]|jgi:predicted PurR-regulated permease PerM|nr:AI-2E family transporter [Sphingomicrobium sp.]